MFRYRIKTLSLAGFAILALLATSARAERFAIGPDAESQIVFVSKAPLETFKGKTRQLEGWVICDPANLLGPVQIEVQVQLASFDTGKNKRNQHMRENHLETERFPLATFRGELVTSAGHPLLTPGMSTDLVIKGSLDLHGVVQQREIPLRVTRTAEGNLHITGEFPIALSDHAIERPKFLVMKLADEQLVQVDLVAVPAEEKP